MKKLFKKGIVVAALMSLTSLTQAQVAQHLAFQNPNTFEHEFGFSSVEFNGYSVFGTEFNRTVNVFKNGQFQFRIDGPTDVNFGHAVGMNQDWLAVGAPIEDIYPNNGSQEYHGAVYLSKSLNGNAQNNFTLKLTPENPFNFEKYGDVLDLDGQWMVIGAPGGRYIEIWNQSGNTWVRKHKFQNPASKFGTSVAIKGNYIIVGSPDENKVYLYKNNNNVWSLGSSYQMTLSTWCEASKNCYYSKFGWDVDITDGFAVVGDPNAAKAAILAINGTQLSLNKVLTHPRVGLDPSTVASQFGHSVAIQWNRVAIGAPIPTDNTTGKVFLYSDGYEYKGSMYVGSPAGIDVKGLGRSVSIDGDIVLSGAEYSDNIASGRYNEGTAFRMPFWYVYQSGSWRTAELESDITTNSTTSSLYPNPTSGSTVTINTKEADVISVQAISSMGETVELKSTANQLDVSKLKSGVYQIRINTSTGVISEKLIKN